MDFFLPFYPSFFLKKKRKRKTKKREKARKRETQRKGKKHKEKRKRQRRQRKRTIKKGKEWKVNKTKENLPRTGRLSASSLPGPVVVRVLVAVAVEGRL